MSRRIKVYFNEMPYYTRKAEYERRKYMRRTSHGGPTGQQFDDEYEYELSDLYGLDGWGTDSEFHDPFGDR